ncbi:MAG: VWA domain-containing protein [Thermodesulfobacterium sp.]|nr:VWA domain-containing protein [Thermodesulfobacterium sp.]
MNFYQSFEDIFPEVLGNITPKLAIFLNLIEPRCGGVLIIGKKGTGKSLMLNCFKKILKISNLPFVEIPIGVTEETLIGGINIEKTIEKGSRVFEEGILDRAKEGFVLIDDINLLPDEYLSLIFEKAENFNLVATLNPEEGVLSPHFLDRFGMCAVTEDLKDPSNKQKLLKLYENNYQFEDSFLEKYESAIRKIESLKVLKEKVRVEEFIWDKISETVLKEFVFSHRAEIFLFYASLAYAAFKGEFSLKENHVDEVSHLVLLHRKREIEKQKVSEEKQKEEKKEDKEDRQDLKPSGERKEHKKENFSQKEKDRSESSEESSQIEMSFPCSSKEEIFGVGEVFKVKRMIFEKDKTIRSTTGRRTKSKTRLKGGRFLRSVIFSKDKDIDLFGTIRSAAPFQVLRGRKNKLIIYKEDFRYKEKERKISHVVSFVVDGSGSMGVQKRMEAVKGAILSLLMDCYQKRDKVSMIMFRKNQAEVVLPPTSSSDLAYKKLKDLPTGGKTPLSLGLLEAYKLIKKSHLKHPDTRIILIVLSDGKANQAIKSGEDPILEVKRICSEIGKLSYVDSVVIDCELKNNFLKMDLAKELAKWLSGKYFLLEDLKAENLVSLIDQIKTEHLESLERF